MPVTEAIQPGKTYMARHWLPVKRGRLANLLARLRLFWKQMNCPHTHTMTYLLDGAYWESSEIRKGHHDGLRLRGCYLCGQVWIEDWKA